MSKRLSKHFLREEFTCNHCGELPDYKPPPLLIDMLEQIREHFNSPVIINSGYRCPVHNRNVGGAVGSQHLKADAADIRVKDVAPSVVYRYCDDLIGDRGGVGSYDTFTHIDVRGHKVRW